MKLFIFLSGAFICRFHWLFCVRTCSWCFLHKWNLRSLQNIFSVERLFVCGLRKCFRQQDNREDGVCKGKASQFDLPGRVVESFFGKPTLLNQPLIPQTTKDNACQHGRIIRGLYFRQHTTNCVSFVSSERNTISRIHLAPYRHRFRSKTKLD